MKQNFWDDDHRAVANELLGIQLVHGKTNAVILEAEGFPREQNESGIYQPIVSMSPGAVYCPRRRNAVLTLIATHNGSCVLIRAIEMQGRMISGPGRVSEALGITETNTSGQVELREGQTVTAVLTLNGAPPPRVIPTRPPLQTTDKITKEVIQRLTTRIAMAFVRRKPGMSYEEFINLLIKNCPDEASLRRALEE